MFHSNFDPNKRCKEIIPNVRNLLTLTPFTERSPIFYKFNNALNIILSKMQIFIPYLYL